MSRIVLVLGMHRSGTSCVTRMLNQCGLYLGDSLLDQPNASNLEGKWEAREVLNINQGILEASDGTWDNVPATIVPAADTPERIERFLAQLAPHGVAGWKEPRTVL